MNKEDAITELLTRGVEDVIVRKDLESLLRSGKKITLYLGIDPTGSRLHIGHAIALRKLRDFQRLGHRVIFLIGNFTALIGDTTDRDSPRQPMTPEQVEENFRTYKAQASKILDCSKIELKYNADWLSKLSFKDLIELANKFTVQKMIQREMFQLRLKQDKPIGLHEFFYPLMQGYDSVAMDVDLEIGGNDQLFNMLAGRVLQKALKNREKHVLTVKLLEGTDGRKMSKTYDNVINITDAPEEQYGKIMSIKDELIVTYFELCTDVALSEMANFRKALGDGKNPRDLKMRLGREIVELYHGADAAKKAEEFFVKSIQKGEAPEDLKITSVATKAWGITDLLVEAGLAASKSEARRKIEEGAVKMDGEKVTDVKKMVNIGKKPIIFKLGRKFAKISILF